MPVCITSGVRPPPLEGLAGDKMGQETKAARKAAQQRRGGDFTCTCLPPHCSQHCSARTTDTSLEALPHWNPSWENSGTRKPAWKLRGYHWGKGRGTILRKGKRHFGRECRHGRPNPERSGLDRDLCPLSKEKAPPVTDSCEQPTVERMLHLALQISQAETEDMPSQHQSPLPPAQAWKAWQRDESFMLWGNRAVVVHWTVSSLGAGESNHGGLSQIFQREVSEFFKGGSDELSQPYGF